MDPGRPCLPSSPRLGSAQPRAPYIVRALPEWRKKTASSSSHGRPPPPAAFASAPGRADRCPAVASPHRRPGPPSSTSSHSASSSASMQGGRPPGSSRPTRWPSSSPRARSSALRAVHGKGGRLRISYGFGERGGSESEGRESNLGRRFLGLLAGFLAC